MRKVKRNLKKCENLEYWVGRREDGFGEGQAVAGTIIFHLNSQQVTTRMIVTTRMMMKARMMMKTRMSDIYLHCLSIMNKCYPGNQLDGHVSRYLLRTVYI